MAEDLTEKTTDDTTESKVETAGPGRGNGLIRNYPIFPLQDALSVGKAIKENNAGNPWPPTEVAKALGYKEKSSKIDNILRASALYGITSGARRAETISLEKIGRELLYAPNADQELLAKRSAFLNVDIFAKVLAYYKGKNLPPKEFLSNTLVSEFSIPVELHDEFKAIFEKNCDFVEIGTEWHGLSTPGHATKRTRVSDSPTVIAHAAENNPLFRDYAIL